MNEEHVELLEYLAENREKLEIMLSARNKDIPLIYVIKGKRTTKTIFFSEALQKLMAKFCEERNIKQGDMIELCIVDYMTRNGYADEVKPLLNSYQ